MENRGQKLDEVYVCLNFSQQVGKIYLTKIMGVHAHVLECNRTIPATRPVACGLF